MDDSSTDRVTKSRKKQMDQVQAMVDHLASQDAEQARTEAIQTARALALVGLPKRRTSDRELVRTLRLGRDLWLRVAYATIGSELPFGEDRFVLAGIQNLALERHSPVVLFDEVSELLKTFDLCTDGRSLERLRERFKRLSGLAIRLLFAPTEKSLNQALNGEQNFIIQRFSLPTREEIRCAKISQKDLPRLYEDGTNRHHCGVVLASEFWEHLKEPKNRLLLPLGLMKVFVNNPTGWDYAAFLVHRCSRARTHSIIDHDVLMSHFKDNPQENDGQTINRLRKCHDLVMTTLAGRLNANLEQAGYLMTGKRGRPKERWILRVGPSQQIVWSGKKDERAGEQ